MPTSGDSEPAATEGATTEGATTEGKPPPVAAASTDAIKRPIKRGAPLRRELVSKLPKLTVAGDAAGAMNVDPDAVDLDADAFIGPLHALVSEGRG